jgi:hypothetical protein
MMIISLPLADEAENIHPRAAFCLRCSFCLFVCSSTYVAFCRDTEYWKSVLANL